MRHEQWFVKLPQGKAFSCLKLLNRFYSISRMALIVHSCNSANNEKQTSELKLFSGLMTFQKEANAVPPSKY